MSNNYFSFKQFTVYQENTAMKVCTDACLLGALVAKELCNSSIDIESILDIGTGTGLLALMLAQETKASIDAVELNAAAAAQARQNVLQSPWANRIRVIETDICDVNPSTPYDFIISNPPFFEQDLKSNDPAKNAAKHDSSLTLDVLVQQINRLLSKSGSAAVMIPYYRSNYFETLLLENNLQLHKKIMVKQTHKHSFFRSMLFFGKEKQSTEQTTIYITDENRNYSSTFASLLKPFYLNL
jgi:tRNA1Val (adenine37-N6)-methyltransferase